MTGAGYTRNFGGFLAEDMWEKIFNEVTDSPTLKSILSSNDFDYELAYHRVHDGDYSNEEKKAINTAILKAYKKLDDIGQKYIPAANASKAKVLSGAKKIIDQLASWDEMNFFFTLNQDLFVERLISDTCKPITTPYMQRFFLPTSIDSKLPIKDADFKTVPTQDKLDNMKHATPLSHKELHYIKLHGSFGWKASDGSDKLVIGRNKENQIANEPLLSWYFFDLFKKVLFQRERKLLIIGYGFRDDHINKVIAEAIERHALKLYIISPTTSSVFKDELIKADQVYGSKIFEGRTGYIRASFETLFPSDGNDTDEWRELKEIFFG